jgi:3,4-dihydroxy 2-butanone 4-phosphate synthase / GTP cyclohydrolase II
VAGGPGENEGDIIIAADFADSEAINFMAKYARGLICISLEEKRIQELELKPMVRQNSDSLETAFTVSCDYCHGTTTGISAADRAATVKALISPDTKPSDLRKPGHLFPLKARNGGVLVRTGHTEASVDLSRIAGLTPSAVICEILNPDGSMARLPQLVEFGKEHGFKLLTISQLISYRRKREQLLEYLGNRPITTKYGRFIVHTFRSRIDGRVHLAFATENLESSSSPLVRVQSECITGDVFNSLECPCGLLLNKSLSMISEEGNGVFVYLQGLYSKAEQNILSILHPHQNKIPEEQESEDLRNLGIGAEILVYLGLQNIRLLTNSSKRILRGLTGFSLTVQDYIPIPLDDSILPPTQSNAKHELL